MPADPRSLVLNLLLGAEARGDAALSARELLAACAAFGVAGNSVRVALARGVAAGLLRSPRRGHYALGPQARPLADEVSQWRQIERRMTDWHGDWVAVHVGASGRSDRAALRGRERAFGLLGLAEFERGLHLRPNNLAGGVAGLRERLAHLVPAGAGTVFAISQLAPADAGHAAALWDTAALDAGYRDTTARLAAWLDEAPTLPLERAAREAFTLGGDAIRRIVFDPLLPAPLVDADARHRFVQTVACYDAAGHRLWRRFLAEAAPSRRPGARSEETAA